MARHILFCVILALLLASCVTGDADQNKSSTANLHQGENSKIAEMAVSENKAKCDVNDGEACYRLADNYIKGWGIEKDFGKARTLFFKACDLNQYEACHNAALIYAVGHGVPKDLEKASVLYEKSCKGGVADGCNRGGMLYSLNGKATGEELRKAEILFNISCDQGNSDGCRLKKLYSDVRSGKDTSRSLYESEFEYQCYEGDYGSCQAQAERYMHGNGPPKDISKAADFYNRACLGGNIGKACHQLGLLYTPGKDNSGNLKKSLAYLERGCDAKHKESCVRLVGIYSFGQLGVPADVEKAISYRENLCAITPTAKYC